MGDTRGVDEVGARLEPWRPGSLDLHHLATGRGDATLVVGTDGSTLLIDAGAVAEHVATQVPARPDTSRRPGEWVARYVRRRLAETGRRRLDQALITHLHPDHFGGADASDVREPGGRYRLTGISDVDAAVGIDRLVDVDHPDYGYPPFEGRDHCANYLAYVGARVERGERVERFVVGSATQLRLGDVEVRNLAARGRVWSGTGDGVHDVFPPREQLAPADYPTENAGSAAVRLRLGDFTYFAAGDLTDSADAGTRPWMDAGTPAARAAGRVSVAVAAHHGGFDACGPGTVAALAPRVWVVSSWHASHPSNATLYRLLHRRLYPGPREVYLTELADAARVVLSPRLRAVASQGGHVVVRVDPGGSAFRVVVTDHRDEHDTVTLVRGPYPSR